MATARAPWLSACSRLMSCRSTRNWRSTPGQLVHVDVQAARLSSPMPSTASCSDLLDPARSWAVARLMKGKSARLRARRMRLLMTMSDSGPEPRSHSPLLARLRVVPVARSDQVLRTSSIRRISSRSSRGPLVMLVGRRLPSFRGGAGSTGSASRSPSGTAWAPCRRAPISPWMLRINGSNWALEADVVVRAAQPPLAAELVEGDPADRAGLLIQLGQLLGRLADGHLLGHLLGQGRGHARRRRPARSPGCVRYSRACSSQRCNSCGLPPVSSVMWNVAGLSHCWHFISTSSEPSHRRGESHLYAGGSATAIRILTPAPRLSSRVVASPFGRTLRSRGGRLYCTPE